MEKNEQPWWLGIRGVMLALFVFAAVVAAGAFLVKPGEETFSFDVKYWTTLKAAIIVACMLGFLGFWTAMLGVRRLRTKSK